MNTKAATFFKKAEQYRTAIMIGMFFLYTVFMQACPSLAGLSHEYKTGMFVVILLLYLAGCFFMVKNSRLTTDDKVFLLITGGVILRSYYVICTGVVDRQHDEGYFSGLSDDLINPATSAISNTCVSSGIFRISALISCSPIIIRPFTTSFPACSLICRCCLVPVTVWRLKTSRL